MKTAALVLVGLQAAIALTVIVMAATARSDAAGEGMAIAYAVMASAVFVVFALPALLVALCTRQQWLALALSILGTSAFIAMMAML